MIQAIEAVEKSDVKRNILALSQFYLIKGDAAFNQGQFAKAERFYNLSHNLATETKDDFVLVASSHGIAAVKGAQGKHAEALELFERILESHKDYLGIWYNRGVALRQLGKYEEAQKAHVPSFKIDTELLTMKIAIVDISSLHLHEQTIPEATERLARLLKKDGLIKDPIIVDSDSLVVLDGMHRVTAAREVGCSRIPVCLVDYDNPSIRIDTWYRAFKGAESDSLLRFIQDLGLRRSEIQLAAAESEVEKKRAVCFFANPKMCVIIGDDTHDTGIHDSYQTVSEIEAEARRRGMEVLYETAYDAKSKLRSGEFSAILGPRKVAKTDVKKYGAIDNPFPHKVTRHMIPARPLGVNFPLETLRDDRVSLEDLNNRLVEDLHSRALMRTPPGSLIEDRRYEEACFLFK